MVKQTGILRTGLKSQSTRQPSACFIAALTIILATTPASRSTALTAHIRLGPCYVTVFAPDWIWQGETINIMAAIRNDASIEADLMLTAECPPDSAGIFNLPVSPSVATRIPPHAKTRLAVAGIRVSPAAPTGRRHLILRLDCSGKTASMEYPISIIRGSLVEKGAWSILLPGLVAFLWCAAILLVLPRYAEKGAWKKPSAVFFTCADHGVVPNVSRHATEKS